MAQIGGVDFRVGAETSQFQQGLDAVLAKFRQFEGVVGKFNSNLSPGLVTINSHLSTMSSRCTAVGTAISNGVNPAFNMMLKGVGAITGAVGLLTRLSLNIGGGFQQQMTTVGTISRATEAEIAALTETARKMGRDLPRTAQDAAEAMTFLAQKGWSVQRIQDTVEHVMNLSISQAYGLAESADILSGIMSAYKMEASQAAEVTDILNNACNQSALSMEKLSYAFKYAAPVASAFGISLKELSSHFAVLANQNLDGSTIGAGWRMVAQRIQQAGADGGLAFRRLGVEVTNSNGSMRDMTSILEDLGTFLSKNPNRASEIMKLFGMRAGTVGMILAQQSGTLRSYEQSLGALGTTQDAVTRRMKDWKTVWDIFISARDDTLITYFDQLQSSIVPVTKRITDMTNEFNKWMMQTKVGEKAVLALAKGFGFSADTGAKFTQWLESIDLTSMLQQFTDFGAGVRALGNAFSTIASAIPWEFIINNLTTIIQVITGFWLTSKVALVIGNITQLFQAFTWLAAHPVVAGLLAIGAAMGYIYTQSQRAANAMAEADKAMQHSMDLEDQAKKYGAARGGDAGSFVLLDADHQKRLIESLASEEALIDKFSKDYQEMIRAKAKELNIQLNAAMTPQAGAIQDIFKTYNNDAVIIKRVKEFIGPELLAAWEESGKQGTDAYMANFQSLPDKVRKVVGKAADELIKARQTRADAGVDKNLLISEDAVQQAMTSLSNLSAQAKQTAKDFGVPLDQMGKELGTKFGKAVEKILEETEAISNNPFLSLAILRDVDAKFASSTEAATEFGKAGLAAFRDITKEADKTKTAIDKMKDQLQKTTDPMSVLVEAMKGGFLKGQDLVEAKNIVQKLANETKTSGAKLVKSQWEEYGVSVSDSLLTGLTKAFTSKTLEGTGLEKVSKKFPDVFGDFVKNAETKAPVAENMFVRMATTAETQLQKTVDKAKQSTEALSQVTIIDNSSQVGEAISKGVTQPTEAGVTALNKLQQAAIRAFDAIIQRGKDSAQILSVVIANVDTLSERMGKLSGVFKVPAVSQEMATPAISKGMVPKTQPTTGMPQSINTRSDVNVSVNIARMEVKNGEEAGESVARTVADRVGVTLKNMSNKYQRDILGALTN